MSQENHQTDPLQEYAGLIRELEQPENHPAAPPPADEFRLGLRRDLINQYDSPGLSGRAARRLWRFAGAAMGIMLLGAIVIYWGALAGRPEAAVPAAAVGTVDTETGRQDAGAPQNTPTELPSNVVGVTRIVPFGVVPPEGVVGTGQVWLVSAVQKARESAADPVTIEFEVGYELFGREEAELQMLYAVPDWQDSGRVFMEGEMRRVPIDSLTDKVQVDEGRSVLWFTFTGNPAEMQEIVGTDRPVLVAQLGYIAGEGEMVQLKLVAMETFGDYPLDLTATEEIEYRPEWDALGIACEASEPELATPPDDPNADPMGEGPYYINEDRTLWLSAPFSGFWRAGGEKVAYIRPAGADLQVTGRRLDADGPPLHADNPCCYDTGFQIGGLIFPTEGCWEVTVTTEEAELRVVTRVLSSSNPPAGGECATLADAVQQSDAIIVGEVLDSTGDEQYAWHNIAINQTWQRPAGTSGIGDRINLLQDLQGEPLLLVGERYVLFVQQSPWQILCPQGTIFHVAGEQVTGLGAAPLWPAGTLSDLEGIITD